MKNMMISRNSTKSIRLPSYTVSCITKCTNVKQNMQVNHLVALFICISNVSMYC